MENDAKMVAKIRQTADRYGAKSAPAEWPDETAWFCGLCCKTYETGAAWDAHVTACFDAASR